MCTGWEVSQIRSIVAETLHEIVEPLVYAEATALIAEHQAAGEEVVVLCCRGSHPGPMTITVAGLGAVALVGAGWYGPRLHRARGGLKSAS